MAQLKSRREARDGWIVTSPVKLGSSFLTIRGPPLATRSPSRKLRLSGRVACVCLPWAGSPGSCGLPVLGRWGTNEPTERGAIDQVSRQGPQRGREAAQGRTEDRSAQQRRQQTFRDPPEESRPEHALQDRGARHIVECHGQIPQGKEHTPAHELQQQAQGTGEVSQGRER